MGEPVYGLDEIELASIIVGKKIVAIDENKGAITLNDGRVLQLLSTTECCAYYTYLLHKNKIVDNIITGVKRTVQEENEDPDAGDNKFTLHILAEAREVGNIEILGSPGNGWYCHSINMAVCNSAGEAAEEHQKNQEIDERIREWVS